MESNKDEAQRCLDLAKEKLSQGEYVAALKMVAKSKKLYPLPKADAIEKLIQQEQEKSQTGSGSGSESESSNSPTDGSSSTSNTSSSSSSPKSSGSPPSSPSSKSSSKPHSGTSHSQSSSSNSHSHSHSHSGSSHSHSHSHRSKTESTAHNHAAEAKKKKESYSAPVRRILDCKTYYEVLELEKECSEVDIKKSYRKLALQYHPDKNSEPGADEAFKVISESFSVLSDKDKRRRYDLVGPERNSGLRGEGSFRDDGMRHQFATEINPEDLFDLFFNGRLHRGAGGNTHFRTYTFGGPRPMNANRERREQDEGGWNLGMLQFIPLLLLLFFSFFSGQANVPSYSLNRADPYVNQRLTTWNQVPYFVTPSFDRSQGTDLRYVRRMEMEIEEIYKTKLQNKCYSERIAKRRVPDQPTPSCDKLSNFNSAS